MAPGEGCVFVCEGSDAWDDAQRLTDFLEAQGIPVWLGWRDKGEISHPADYFDARANAAGRCAAFVLLLSADPADARDLRDLAGLAHARGKPIFPVLVSERAPLADFAAVMGDRPWTSTFGNGADERLDRLVDQLRAVLAGDPDAQPRIARITPAAGGASLAAPRVPAPAPQPPSAGPDQADAAPEEAVVDAGAAAAAVESEWPDEPILDDGESEHDRMLRAFVGPRAVRYLERWSRGGAIGWNWAALAFPFLWPALRKLWLTALVVGLALLMLLGAGLAVRAWVLPAIGGAVALALVTAIFADQLYRRRAERAVARTVRRDLGPHARLARLQAKGGRSWFALVLVLLVWTWAAAMIWLFADPRNALCLGDACVQARDVPWRPPLLRSDAAAAGPGAEAGVTSGWLAGRWGVEGTGCRIWIAFNADGTLADNAGGTGRWSLEQGSGDSATIVLVPDRTGEEVPALVARRGATMMFGAQGTTWSRDGC